MFRNFQFSMAGTQLEFVFSALFASLRFSWSSRFRSDHRLVCAFTLAAVLALSNALAAPLNGHLPVGKDGTPKDWTATGQAFDKQPIKGDTISPRRGDMRSDHQGNYWIGTFEISGDK